MALMNDLKTVDPEVAAAIDAELNRQRNKLELIASENIVSTAVMTAQGSVLTNKYAEGYPGKRYYGGCEHVDVVEQLAIDRAKELIRGRRMNFTQIADHLGYSSVHYFSRQFKRITDMTPSEYTASIKRLSEPPVSHKQLRDV